ncbi:hypothetical protein A2U01_0038351, partial [Trifolium medium]|nr:hypothetical protein [Trifolium medium]
DGCQARFSDDKWLDDKLKIIDYIYGSNPSSDIRDWKVQDIVSATGEWDYDMIPQLVPSRVLQKLHAVLPLNASNGPDVPWWPG